jgi:plasmid stability protein
MNITVKNIPDNVHQALKRRARLNKRSLNSEILSCLEAAVAPARLDADAFLDEIRQLRELAAADFDLDRALSELGEP